MQYFVKKWTENLPKIHKIWSKIEVHENVNPKMAPSCVAEQPPCFKSFTYLTANQLTQTSDTTGRFNKTRDGSLAVRRNFLTI